MNKIVLEHYPASRLPAELREGLGADASVRVTVEEEPRPRATIEGLRESILAARRNASGVTLEEAVRRVRELRDEWE